MKQKTIICLANTAWFPAWQRHQIFMTALSQEGYDVYYIEHVPFRFPKAVDFVRILNRSKLKRALKIDTGNVKLVSLKLFPSNKLPWLWLNRKSLEKLKSMVKGEVILWTYLPNDISFQVVKICTPKKIIYDCCSNFPGHPEAPENIVEMERALIGLSDIVLTDSISTLKRIKLYDDKRTIHYLPPGVDEDFLQDTVNDSVNCKEEVKIRTACWFGTISRFINEELIYELAVENTEWMFYFIGHEQVGLKRLKSLKNTVFLGPMEHSQLPSKLKKFDCFLLPYRKMKFIQEVMPAKIFELLALGKPIVSVPLDSLNQYSDYIYFGTWDSLGDAFKRAILELSTDDKLPMLRRDLARVNLWNHRIAKIRELLEE